MFKEYDYESDRDCAFVIIDGKVYEGDLHFECFINYLTTKGYDEQELFQLDDMELEDMIGEDIYCGELTKDGDIIIYESNPSDYRIVIDEIKPNKVYTYCLGYIREINMDGAMMY